uniref:hypothetical protein n=1 Tax=Halorubrum lacusprofundi TaxID=2247 RepID=UPI00197AAE8D
EVRSVPSDSDDGEIDREYVDVRELMGYRRVPCKVEGCDDFIRASPRFDPDEWYCRTHLPERLDKSHLSESPEVRI